MTTPLEGGKWSASCPGHVLPPGKTRYPFYWRLDGPQGRSGQVRKISPPPGFDPPTVQPVASRYIDWATGPPKLCKIWSKLSLRKQWRHIELHTYLNLAVNGGDWLSSRCCRRFTSEERVPCTLRKGGWFGFETRPIASEPIKIVYIA